jgi:hypothetical protein
LSILSQLGSIELASERDDPLADPYLLDWIPSIFISWDGDEEEELDIVYIRRMVS